MTRLTALLFSIVAVALLGGVACSSDSGSAGEDARTPGTTTADGEHASHTPAPDSFNAHMYDPPEEIPDFALTDQEGEEFRLSDTAGKVRLVYFGYTNCPDICPTTLLTWKDAHKQLGDDAEDVEFIMVTVDPEFDTPEVLRKFVRAFHPSFVGLSGTMAELTPVWASFRVQVEKEAMPDSAAGYSVGHTAATFVLDKEGRLRLKFPFTATSEELVQDIRRLLAE